MTKAIKGVLLLFAALGIAATINGAWQILETRALVASATGKSTAQFVGYFRDYRRVSSGRSQIGSGTPSVASYPEFAYRAEDELRTVRETRVHIVELYEGGQSLEILLLPQGAPRLASFYSLYALDLLILVSGLAVLLLSGGLWRYVIPLLSSADSIAIKESFGRFLDQKIGPVSARAILWSSGIFLVTALAVIALSTLSPYVSQMSFGAGGRLIEAIKDGRFDEARTMIEENSGINATDEHGQTPLLLALEAGQRDLSKMLIKAGADTNARSKMLMTPLRIAAESGDLEMVKLLLANKSLPQHPEDKVPPFLYAMSKGNVDVARVLVENGTDLRRRYGLGNRERTVGDMAVLAKNKELVELIRLRGGVFTLETE